MLVEQEPQNTEEVPLEKRCTQCGGILGEEQDLLDEGYGADELCYCFDEPDFSGASDELGYAPDR